MIGKKDWKSQSRMESIRHYKPAAFTGESSKFFFDHSASAQHPSVSRFMKHICQNRDSVWTLSSQASEARFEISHKESLHSAMAEVRRLCSRRQVPGKGGNAWHFGVSAPVSNEGQERLVSIQPSREKYDEPCLVGFLRNTDLSLKAPSQTQLSDPQLWSFAEQWGSWGKWSVNSFIVGIVCLECSDCSFLRRFAAIQNHRFFFAVILTQNVIELLTRNVITFQRKM